MNIYTYKRSWINPTRMSTLPADGYVKGLGHVRIVGYLGPDHFRVLTRKDRTYLIPRSRLTMLAS